MLEFRGALEANQVGLAAKENRDLSILDVRGQWPELIAGPPLLGPQKIAECSWFQSMPSTSLSSLWMRPHGWWIVGSRQAISKLEVKLGSLVSDECSLMNISHQHAVLRMGVSEALDVLAQGCSVEVTPQILKMGGYRKVKCAGVPLLLYVLPDQYVMDIFVDRSLSRYFGAWLDDAQLNVCASQQPRVFRGLVDAQTLQPAAEPFRQPAIEPPAFGKMITSRPTI